MKQLEVPSGAQGQDAAVEMIRFWINGGQDHVSINTGMFATADEPACWGMIAADIVKHAVLGMLEDDPSRDVKSLFAQMDNAFAKRFAENVKVSGQIKGGSQ